MRQTIIYLYLRIYIILSIIMTHCNISRINDKAIKVVETTQRGIHDFEC